MREGWLSAFFIVKGVEQPSDSDIESDAGILQRGMTRGRRILGHGLILHGPLTNAIAICTVIVVASPVRRLTKLADVQKTIRRLQEERDALIVELRGQVGVNELARLLGMSAAQVSRTGRNLAAKKNGNGR